MKTKISPYIKSLLKKNSVYISINILLIVILIFFIAFNFNLIPDKQNSILKEENEVAQLQKRDDFLNSPIAVNAVELDSSLKLLNSLIPNSEDYFSVITVLEELSKKTNFIIDSYDINLTASGANKLQLSVSGKGDQESFIKFLKEYNYGGGRLITSSNIQLSAKYAGTMTLIITFYNKTIAKGEALPLDLNSKDQEEIAKLKNKVDFTLKEEKLDDLSYPKKSNPF